MKNSDAEPKIIPHLSVLKLSEGKGVPPDYNRDFLKYFSQITKDIAKQFFIYFNKYHPETTSKLQNCVYVYIQEPTFNASFRKNSFVQDDTKEIKNEIKYGLGEISINLGVPTSLAYLKPVFSYLANSFVNKDKVKKISDEEILIHISRLFAGWRTDRYPGISDIDESIINDISYAITIRFLIAHELSHFLFYTKEKAKNIYFTYSDKLLEGIISNSENLLNSSQISHLKNLFQYGDIVDSWVEEIAADVLAFDMCEMAFPRVPTPLSGAITMIVMSLIIEGYLESFRLKPSYYHPYSFVRFLALAQYLQERAKIKEYKVFANTFDWAYSHHFYFSIRRILSKGGDLYTDVDFQ